ncbi:hypothetical protein QQP08_018952 [Theobroma cacao]|nr:hypothetical protein QQP08_018952 [Theobroma cacao]
MSTHKAEEAIDLAHAHAPRIQTREPLLTAFGPSSCSIKARSATRGRSVAWMSAGSRGNT